MGVSGISWSALGGDPPALLGISGMLGFSGILAVCCSSGDVANLAESYCDLAFRLGSSRPNVYASDLAF